MGNDEFVRFKRVFENFGSHLIKNSSEVDLYVPVNKLYFEQTTYLTDGSDSLINAIESMVKQSSGQIVLTGLISESDSMRSFSSSALYSQVAHFSSFLLKKDKDVSYSPITIERYERNDSYRFWDIFPETDRFIRLSLIVD